MAASQPGTLSLAQKANNRIFLFRLQMLIIDGGLTSLRNYVDQKLAALSTTLSAFLAKEKARIKLILNGRKIITKVQYDLLYPSSGTVSVSDLDITLIIFLMRNLKIFGLNSKFNWNIPPVQSDTSIEADICRLKLFRNEICHISTTTGIQHNDFINKWQEIEQVLLRIDKVYPIKDFQQTITDFKSSILDPKTEKWVTDEIEKWSKFDKSLKQTNEAHTMEIAENRKRTLENKEGLETVNVKIRRIEKELPAKVNYQQRKLDLKDELITWYNKNHSTVPLSPLTDDAHTPLAGFYIMPKIDIQTNLGGGRKEQSRAKSLQDLFTPSKTVSKEIYLSAPAGFGKTSFSKYLAITWCQAHKKDENYKHFKGEELKALSGFEFLFLVLLRYSDEVCDVDDMIEQQVIKYLPCKSSLPEGLLKDILKHEKCLIILDGLDEWSHPDKNCSKSIPHIYAREKCVILTTTRPWKLGESNLKSNQIDKRVELVQIDKDNASQFNRNAMKILKGNIGEDNLEKEVRRFEKEIRSHDLENMELTPLLLLYLLCLWIAEIPISNSAVELYTCIIQLLLSRTEKLHAKFHSSCETSPSEVPECFRKHQHFCRYYTFLKTIGKLAFYTLFSKKKKHRLVFDEKEAKTYDINQEDLISSYLSGILSGSKENTLTNISSKISFSHKTVQEYFSAIFISFQNTNEVQKTIFEECNCLQNILHMSKVFVFISNMNPKLMSAISSDLMPVINKDEKTSKYRTMTYYDYVYIDPLQDIQDMYIYCAKEGKGNKDLKLCLQDYIINKKCQQENYFKQLQHLCQQNKENIKSIMIQNEGICGVQEIINFFTLSDLPHIEKLYYKGEIVEEEIMSLLLNHLKCLTVISQKWENNQFVKGLCRLSAEINRRLVQLQHLECLRISFFTMTHEVMETLFNFLTSKKLMKEISLDSLYCSDHDSSCTGFNLDLSQHSQLRCLGLNKIPVSQLNMDVSLLEECCVGELYNSDVVSSYLRQLPAASKLQLFQCSDQESSTDIETMLKTIPSLHHMTYVGLFRINLGERSLTLTPQMVNIERVVLYNITMSCSVLHDLISVLKKLPNTVTVQLCGCDIKPKTEFEDFKILIKQSDKFEVIRDDTFESGGYRYRFKTTKCTK